jgi:phosphopantothenoylcysteine synthetase/decarboxylase
MEQLQGRFLEAYEFAVRTHVTRTIRAEDAHLAERYPKLTILAMSQDFQAKTAHDILLAKQMQELGTASADEIFQRTSDIGKSLGQRYLRGDLRPSDAAYEVAKSRLRKKQEEEGDEA